MARGNSTKPILSFNAGEWSPRLEARFDLEKYSSACSRLENNIVLPSGASDRRPGFKFVGITKDGRIARLATFTFSLTTTFLLEFTANKCRFYSNRVQVESGGSPYEIATPWGDSEIFELSVAQINDVMFVTCAATGPRTISRVTDTNWVLAEPTFNTPPLLDENTTATTITASATLGNVDLVASADVFPNAVGAYFQITHLRAADVRELPLTADGTSAVLDIFGTWNVRTYGSWEAEIRLERTLDFGTTWEIIRRWTGKTDRNIDQTGEEESTGAIYRLVVDNYVTSTGTPRVVLEAGDAFVYGLVKLTEWTDAQHVKADVLVPLHSTDPTKYWAEGAWSSYRGFPAAVTFHEQRLCFGGTAYQPQTVWGSKIGEYLNYKTGLDDTDAFVYTLASKRRVAIKWMESQDDLVVGTDSEEWALGPNTDIEASILTPTSVRARRQSGYGSSSPLASALVNEVIMFVQAGGKKVRELTYRLDQDNYVAPDMTVLADHIAGSGVVQTAYQSKPHAILWAVTSNGGLIGLTYERDQNVIAWHRHTTKGKFKSIAVLPGPDGDEVWAVIERTTAGGTACFVELMNPEDWENKEDAFYVDSGLSYSGVAATNFTGLSHLIGETVQILADGAVVPPQVVALDGSITLPQAASKVQAGLQYISITSPLRLDSDPQLGSVAGQMKIIYQLIGRFMDTLGAKYGQSMDALEQVPFRGTSDPMDASAPLASEDVEMPFNGRHDTEGRFFIVQDQPLPMTILSVQVKHRVTGK